MASPLVTHDDIVRYADRSINLHQDDVKKYREQVTYMRDQLGSYISKNPDYDLVKMLNSGSVAKGTALKTINDIDVAVYVRKARAPTDEKRLLEWLVDRLREVYPTMASDQFQVRTHCVRVSYRGSGLDVDVVPVLYEGDPQDRGYLLDRDTGEFLLTSIPMHLDFIRKRKEMHPQHFAQIVRLVKWWVRERHQVRSDFRFKSFMVELLVAYLVDRGLDPSDYPRAMEGVFAFVVKSELKERIAFSDYYPLSSLPAKRRDEMEVFDPVNPENNVASSYSDSDRRAILEAAHDVLDALNEAHHATTRERAISRWQVALGPSFGR